MIHDHTRAWLLILSVGIIVLPGMGTTVTIDNATLADIGDTAQIGLTLDQVPLGLAGYAISISFENPGPAEIISVSFPPWATLNDNSTLPADTLTIMAADLGFQVGNGSTNVPLANVTIRADAPGTTRITVDSSEIDDREGSPVIPVIQGGYLTVLGSDLTPPAAITDLHNTTFDDTTITWVWTDPPDSDFSKVKVFLDGVFQANVTKGTQSYTAGSLIPGTQYTLGTRTVDTSENVNETWVNQTAMTAPAQPVPPDSITNLTNTTYQQGLITWTWTDPTSADFDHVMVFFNGVFQTNVTRGTQIFTVSGLSPSTAYTIATHTVGATGPINQTWVNSTAWTAPAPPGPKGFVFVYTIPFGATISLDGIERGQTKQFVSNVTAGIRNLTLTKPGYHSKTISVDVPAGDVKVLRPITLQPVTSPSADTGALYVYSSPSNAIISVDGTERGRTNQLVTGVAAGTRNLTLAKPGYQIKTISVSVRAGDVEVLPPIELIPLQF